MPEPLNGMLPNGQVGGVPNNQVPGGNQPNDVPGRVVVALNFLRYCSQKTSPSIAVHPNGVDKFDGDMLEAVEVHAQEAAGRLLKKYFDGDLHLSGDERLSMHGYGAGASHQCYHCLQRGQVSPNCRMCNGSGTIIVFAATRGG